MKRMLLLTLLAATPARLSVGRPAASARRRGKSRPGTPGAGVPPERTVDSSGDSVTWSFPTGERHTVSFLTPSQLRPKFQVGCPGSTPDGSSYTGATCVNSDVLMNGQTYTVTFPQHGNFKLACLVHLYMTGGARARCGRDSPARSGVLRPRGRARAARVAVGRGRSRGSRTRDRTADVRQRKWLPASRTLSRQPAAACTVRRSCGSCATGSKSVWATPWSGRTSRRE